MLTKVQYKGYEFSLKPQTVNDMHQCLQNDTGIDIIVYLLKISQNDGYTSKRFCKVAEVIRSLFFAMNPAMNYYEKVKVFFEYSNCVISEIPEYILDDFEEIDIAIYTIIKNLRHAFEIDEE